MMTNWPAILVICLTKAPNSATSHGLVVCTGMCLVMEKNLWVVAHILLFWNTEKKNKKVVEEKVEQGDFNNFDLFDFYVSSFETPGMSFNVQIHPDIDGEETEEEKKTLKTLGKK